MIVYVPGDLLETYVEVICHGVNCMGGFGSGVAGQIAKTYPKARHYYLDKFEEEGWKLGEVQFVKQWDDKVIANCATQHEYLPRGIEHVNYDAVKSCMEKVRDYCEKHKVRAAFPKIGSGLAGGNWQEIEKIANAVFANTDVLVYTRD